MSLTTQKYDILSRIAVGSGALVYRALDKTTMRQVALKLLVQDGELEHRFDVESLMADTPRLRQIAGAHVCQLLDAYVDEDGPVLVYEFANGQNGMELPAQRKLEPVHALDVAAQLISALRSGERQRCPHGDLKPSNIVFVDLPEGRPFLLVLDWGLSALRTSLLEDSLPFIAPERLAGEAPSHRSDLFSAGAILFFLFTGRALAGGATAEELQAAWPQARPAMLAELRPDLPSKLVQWVCSLLELDPEKRPRSAVEAGAALAALNPPPPLVPPESIRPRPVIVKPVVSGASGIARPPVTRATAQLTAQLTAVETARKPAVSLTRSTVQTVAAPATSSHMAVTISLYAMVVAILGVAGWLVFSKKDEAASVAEQVVTDNVKPGVARTPAPSVGSSIARPYVPPPIPPPPARAIVPTRPAVPATTANAPPKPSVPKPVSKAARPATAPVSPLIATESFEYEERKPIDGLGGGDGWAGPWRGPLATMEAKSLGFPPIPSRGGCLILPPTQEEIVLSRAVGPLKGFVDPAKGGEWCFAFLLRHAGDLPAPGGDIELNPFNQADVHDLVRIVATDVGGALHVTLNNEKSFLEAKDRTKPAFVALRTILGNPKSGNWDVTAELYLNPVIDPPRPPRVGQKMAVKLTQVRVPEQLGLLIRKPPRSGATTRIDEIRFARHPGDLTSPPPSPPPKTPTAAPGAAAPK